MIKNAVKILKGVSGHKILKTFQFLKEIVKKDTLWSPYQEKLFREFAGSCRWVWNMALSLAIFFLKFSLYLGYNGFASQ
jgi:hypothetical protein